MMLTEKEARLRWCPFVRLTKADGDGEVAHGQAVFNRVEIGSIGAVGIPDASRCIASLCMAWRWAEKHPPERKFSVHVGDFFQTEQPERPAQVPASWEWCQWTEDDPSEPPGWLEPENEIDARRRGFCGLAGRVD